MGIERLSNGKGRDNINIPTVITQEHVNLLGATILCTVLFIIAVIKKKDAFEYAAAN